ncbi:MAG: HAD-IC family P-type ATPase [Acidimicrobiales bacterium]|nr:HAD-IC family P-type ATPase [Acidimicrobiales bacterium]RZV46782.1 MAG: HAD family hydrolase [Acidimicrobiales bacterium]
MTPDASATLPTDASGLTTAEANQRREAGLGNAVDQQTGRSIAGILHANVFTRFNAIITSLVVVVLLFGDPIDAVFGLVMVANSTIGIVQEIRAKRSLERVQVLLIPEIATRRDGTTQTLNPDDLVQGDVILLKPGDQVPVDGLVRETAAVEVDESALTGESRPVPKAVGDEVFSGSYVIAGDAVVEATKVGEASWAHQLMAEAKEFALTESELRVGINRLLRVIGWILPPLSLILLLSQLNSSSSWQEGLVWAVAGVVALVPQGLVLLVSMALAVAVIRLARDNVVVQELPAVEGLARVDILCVDKTGTLTTGDLVLDRISETTAEDADVHRALHAFTRVGAARNATIEAIERSLPVADDAWAPQDTVPFSSQRKWSATSFGGHGAWFLGAPEILLESAASEHDLGPLEQELADMTSQARRVLLLASGDELTGEDLPSDLRPRALIALREEVRPDAGETMAYFRTQNVGVRVISGDNPVTVSAVASELGLPGASRWIDMRTVESLDEIPADTVVFGRVLPDQKRDLVRFLQDQGHVVAMTGDGVNDIPSLKVADIGIAMDSATPATKSIAQLVLLDGRFDRLPGVVAEGRRVIANMERVSSLFVTKTVYAALLAFAVGVLRVPFPFLPRHLSLIATFTIGVPAFALSFRSSNEPCRPGYLDRVMHFAVPAGIFAAMTTFATYWIVRSDAVGASLEEARTSATLALTLAGLFVLHRLIRPVGWREVLLLTSMLGAFIVNLIPSPLADFYALNMPELQTSAIVVAVLAVLIVVLEIVLTGLDRRRAQR